MNFSSACILLIAAILLCVTPATAQPTLIQAFGPPHEEAYRFGEVVTGVPDTNGDGHDDVLIGASAERLNQSQEGRAYLVSGANGDVLHELAFPDNERGTFAVSVSGVPDTDGDGRGDLLVGARSGGQLLAFLFSGASGAVLLTWEISLEGVGHIPSMAGIPDADGDGRGDILIGNLEEEVGDGPWGGSSGAGRVYLYSGATGALLRAQASPNVTISGYFGASVSGVPGVDGDGRSDLLVGAPGENYPTGRAYLFSGATGTLLHVITAPNDSPTNFAFFGSSVAGVPDTNGDGRGDLLIGAPWEDHDDGPHAAGRAYLFSGSDGALIFEFASSVEEEERRFGWLVAGVPDADGDQRGDLLISDDRLSPNYDNRNSQVFLYSGATGDLMLELSSPNEDANGLFGISVASGSDMDNDGRGDIIIGASGEPRVYAFSGNPNPVGTESPLASRPARANLYPNPAVGATRLTLMLTHPSEVTVEAYDLLGRQWLREDLGLLSAGTVHHDVNLSALARGMYTINIRSGDAAPVSRQIVVVE